jgi:two-component system, NtrC family, response regulator HydG
MYRILVVDDDETLRLTLVSSLSRAGHKVEAADDGLQAIEMVKKSQDFDFILLDVNMPNISGLKALEKIKELKPQTSVLILTAYSNVQDAVTAIKNGAYDYLEKPVETSKLIEMMQNAKNAHGLVELASLSAPSLLFDHGRKMIGDSRSMNRVFEIINKLSKVDTSVLIRGESGTGKELVARALHFNSQRKKGPFVAVNCAAIPENLIESELFGHEKGAFTGADKKKIGKFQFASGGTLFLDEIGDITQQMQVKLLRVLQEKQFTSVGSNHEVAAKVRIIAATNRHLEDMIKDGSFRSDLFYRLNVLPITLPPLRDRAVDIPELANFMVIKFNQVHGREITKIDPQAVKILTTYAWPGNIRELENVIEHAFIVGSGNTITAEDLPSYVFKTDQIIDSATGKLGSEVGQTESNPETAALIPEQMPLNYPMMKEKFERDFIIKALQTYHGKINQTAEHTQMTKVTLLRKLDKYGINPRDFYKS